jgi:glycerol-3-phosphate acyltransferase PlsY
LESLHFIWIFYAGASFLLGAVPSGRLIGRGVARIDITQRGSGNIGATNVAREVGLKWGIVTLALDLIKGFIPVFFFLRFYPHSQFALALVGVSALIGHQFSIFLRFRGGKGVATALGIYLAISPFNALIALCGFVVIVYISDFVSLASMLSACIMPILFVMTGKPLAMTLASLLMAGLICFRHKDNIGRLVRGEERKWRKRQAMSAVQEADPTPHQNRKR